MDSFARKQDESIKVRFKNPITKEKLVISDFKYQMDNEDKKMIKAKVKYENGQVFHICFRNSQEIRIAKMREDGVFVALAKIGAFDSLKHGKYNYFGKIIRAEDKKKNPYIKADPSQEDIEYVRKNMDTQLEMWEERQRYKELEEQLQELSDQEKKNDFKDSIKVSDEKLEEYFNKKEENKENAFLRSGILEDKETKEEEKIYEGVDLTTGDFLILKNLKEMELDDQYIYEGYLTYLDTLEEKDTKTKKELESYEVIFELPYKIDSSIEKGDFQSVLQLLSKNEKLLKAHEFNYLGKINESGKIDRVLNSSDRIFNYYKLKAENIRNRYEKEQGKAIE